jgi:hypothetical protein
MDRHLDGPDTEAEQAAQDDARGPISSTDDPGPER